ncbi:MAG TPA: polysaccharide deacetylase family protein [Chitinophagaceae bacterium]|nr:polysaccharide deacetylase family protein [Chitinophagaceae bacterium]
MKIIFLSIILAILWFGCRNAPQNNPGSNNNKKDSDAKVKPDTVVKHIYITFDDGPLEGSEDIDDAVRTEQVKVNVFVVGRHALRNDSMRRFYKLYQNNPYIEIGNHSFSHAHNHYEKFYKNPSAVVADFLKCQTELQIPNKIARQPGRNQWRLKGIHVNDVRSGSVSADMLYKQSFKVFGWDVEWQHDPKTGVPVQTVDDMVELIERKLKEHKTVKPNHLVLLAHDEMFRNGWEESELKQLIDKLKAKGNYRFEHLSSYPD